MTNREQETTVEYLKYLITQEKRDKNKGWEQMIDSYNDTIREYDIIQKYAKGGIETEKNKLLK